MGKTNKQADHRKMDVLLGRGKRVSEWPGNVYFRKVINLHRDAYNSAHRSHKVQIAELVISEITKVEGRFLKEETDGSWTIVDHDRAVEKTCQALREKEKPEKPNPPDLDPFLKPNKRMKLLPRKRISSSRNGRRRSNGNNSSSEDDDDDVDYGKSDDDAADDSVGRMSSNESTVVDEEEPEVSATASSSASVKEGTETAARAASETDMLISIRMMEKLERFRRLYGHCGVPPKWPKDVALADWCSRQRQVRREIGYRDLSPEEEERIRELDSLGFPWDYGEWHWDDRYQNLRDIVQLKNHDDEEMDEKVLLNELPPGAHYVFPWLQDQRCQLRTGSKALTAEQAKKLDDIGIVL